MVIRGLYLGLTVALVLALAVCAPLRAAEEPTVEEYYRGVLARMSSLPEPALVSYDVVVRASGATFYVSRDPQNGEAEFGFAVSPALGDTSQWWPVLVRPRDNATSVLLEGAHAVTRFPALNATWGGLDSWMRFGMQVAPARASASDSETTPDRPQLPVIAVVHVLDIGIYRVSDGGPTSCADHSPARLLHLSAREDPSRHPATDITVQTSTQTICTIRFDLERSDLVDRNGHVELHLAQIGAYYLVDRGEISFDAGPNFGRKHVRMFVDFAGIAFPAASPPDAFSTPLPDAHP